MKDYELKGPLEDAIDDILIALETVRYETEEDVYYKAVNLEWAADIIKKRLQVLSGLSLIQRFEKRLIK
jgi:hypothetical protein